MSTFGERLHDAMTIAGVSVARLAKLRDVSPQTVRVWLRMKDAKLSGTHLVSLGLDLAVGNIWLALGIGSPEPIVMEAARKARLAMREP